VDSKDSLENVESKWVSEIAENCQGAKLVLVALKCDLRENSTEDDDQAGTGARKEIIDYQQGLDVARRIGVRVASAVSKNDIKSSIFSPSPTAKITRTALFLLRRFLTNILFLFSTSGSPVSRYELATQLLSCYFFFSSVPLLQQQQKFQRSGIAATKQAQKLTDLCSHFSAYYRMLCNAEPRSQ
jgi:hypothetical protein